MKFKMFFTSLGLLLSQSLKICDTTEAQNKCYLTAIFFSNEAFGDVYVSYLLVLGLMSPAAIHFE